MSDNPYLPGQHAGEATIETDSRTRVIKRFAPLQLGKFLAVLYFALSLLFVPIFLIISSLAPKGSQGQGFAYGIGIVIGVVLFYTVFGFVSGIIGALIYNVCAKMVGGIKVEIE